MEYIILVPILVALFLFLSPLPPKPVCELIEVRPPVPVSETTWSYRVRVNCFKPDGYRIYVRDKYNGGVFKSLVDSDYPNNREYTFLLKDKWSKIEIV